MNKTEFRKKILNLRKKNDGKNLQINFHNIFRILQKSKGVGKIVGGYYPYNYEVDTIKIFKKFEKKKNISFHYQKSKKIFKWIFFNGH